DLTAAEISARAPAGADVAAWLGTLAGAHRALGVRIHGEERWIAVEDAARYPDGLGGAPPGGGPPALPPPGAQPGAGPGGRFARPLGPFLAADAAGRFGLGVAVVEHALRALEMDGRVVDGEFRPGGSGREWIDVEVLRRLRRRSLAALRREIEPVPPEQL